MTATSQTSSGSSPRGAPSSVPAEPPNVRLHDNGIKDFHHPVVSDITLTYNRMDLAADPGQMLTICLGSAWLPEWDLVVDRGDGGPWIPPTFSRAWMPSPKRLAFRTSASTNSDTAWPH